MANPFRTDELRKVASRRMEYPYSGAEDKDWEIGRTFQPVHQAAGERSPSDGTSRFDRSGDQTGWFEVARSALNRSTGRPVQLISDPPVLLAVQWRFARGLYALLMSLFPTRAYWSDHQVSSRHASSRSWEALPSSPLLCGLSLFRLVKNSDSTHAFLFPPVQSFSRLLCIAGGTAPSVPLVHRPTPRSQSSWFRCTHFDKLAFQFEVARSVFTVLNEMC